MDETKTCKQCGETKALESFHRNPKTLDGRQGRCKPCACAAQQERYRSRPEAERAASRLRYETARERGALQYQIKDPTWLPKRNAARKRYAQNNPAKEAARRTVHEAIRTGAMKVEPCERCGSTERIHAHHESYSKPLKVMWLCPLHHKQRHRELRTRYGKAA